MGKDLPQSEMPNWRLRDARSSILSEKVPNSKPVSSCRHAINHFSSDELGILEGLSRGVVESWS